MKAGDVMTRDVATIRPECPVIDALRTMLERRISGLPVVDAAGSLVGILTEGDFLRRAELDTERKRPLWLAHLLSPGRLAGEYTAAHGRTVAQVMTTDVAAVGQDAPLAEVVGLMERRGIKRVPVIAHGKVIGLVSRADLLRAYVAAAEKAAPGHATDAEIERAIATEIDRQPWGPASNVRVGVVNGTAEMRGVLIDDRERTALRVLVENTPGVKCVRDLLTTIEPMTGVVVRNAGDA
jgi:CBS domain-containing protein